MCPARRKRNQGAFFETSIFGPQVNSRSLGPAAFETETTHPICLGRHIPAPVVKKTDSSLSSRPKPSPSTDARTTLVDKPVIPAQPGREAQPATVDTRTLECTRYKLLLHSYNTCPTVLKASCRSNSLWDYWRWLSTDRRPASLRKSRVMTR
ncbi:hypothetical protein VTJ04DRAFT_2657 [Mycothermus thermophilus]|uniref:uncharacterized protein n=1 Tax=Humicola insolens TaxID=85995 RepID=UPI003743F8A3